MWSSRDSTARCLATYRDWSVSRLSKASGNSVKLVLRNTLKEDESGQYVSMAMEQMDREKAGPTRWRCWPSLRQ